MRRAAIDCVGIALAALALVAAPRAARAQQDPARGDDPRLAARLDAPTRAAVAAQLDSARVAGLPTEPLVQKALQGAMKGADGARIGAAVHRLRDELTGARQALGARASAAELEAGASAIHAGAHGADLAALRTAHPDRALTVALATLSDLVAQGVPVDTAVAVTRALWERGASDDELVEVRRAVARDVHDGATPAAAALVRAHGAGRGAGPGGAAAGVPKAPRGRGSSGRPGGQKPGRP